MKTGTPETPSTKQQSVQLNLQDSTVRWAFETLPCWSQRTLSLEGPVFFGLGSVWFGGLEFSLCQVGLGVRDALDVRFGLAKFRTKSTKRQIPKPQDAKLCTADVLQPRGLLVQKAMKPECAPSKL